MWYGICSCPKFLLHSHGSCTGQDVGKFGLLIVVRNNPYHLFDFANHTVIYAKTTEILAEALVAEQGSRAAGIASLLDQDQGPGLR